MLRTIGQRWPDRGGPRPSGVVAAWCEHSSAWVRACLPCS